VNVISKRSAMVCEVLYGGGAQAIERRLNGFAVAYSRSTARYYRLDIVIAALNKIAYIDNINATLVIIGWAEIQRVLRFASLLGVKEKVRYLGVISDCGEVARIVAAADVGVIPFDANPPAHANQNRILSDNGALMTN
jgi:hypothetical protein